MKAKVYPVVRPLPTSLAEAVHAVFYDSEIPAKSIAEQLDKSYSYLADCTHGDSEKSIPSKLIIPMTILTGNDALIQYLCRACGYIAHQIPQGHPACADLTGQLVRILSKFSATVKTSSDAISDGVISRDEADEIKASTSKLITKLLEFSDSIETAVEE